MSAVNSLILIGAWLSLLAGFGAWAIWRENSTTHAKWLPALAVLLFYWSLVLRHWLAESWDPWDSAITRFDVSGVLVPIGLFCCLADGRWMKGLGVTLIAAGFINVFPGLLYPLEGVKIEGK